MTLSCKKASELISQADEGVKLTFRQRLSLKFHLGLCLVCRKYKKHFECFNSLCCKYLQAIEKHEPEEFQRLSPECKKRLQHKIEEECKCHGDHK